MQATQGGPDTGTTTPTGTGLAPNVAAALSYLLGLVSGLVFLLIEKDKFVRFHAMQSIIVSIAWMVIWFLFTALDMVFLAVPGLRVMFVLMQVLGGLVLTFGGLVVWILLMVRAYQGQEWHLPYIGQMAERYASQIKG